MAGSGIGSLSSWLGYEGLTRAPQLLAHDQLLIVFHRSKMASVLLALATPGLVCWLPAAVLIYRHERRIRGLPKEKLSGKLDTLAEFKLLVGFVYISLCLAFVSLLAGFGMVSGIVPEIVDFEGGGGLDSGGGGRGGRGALLPAILTQLPHGHPRRGRQLHGCKPVSLAALAAHDLVEKDQGTLPGLVLA